jgi:hypothetical protein
MPDARGESLYQYNSSEASCAGGHPWPALACVVALLGLAKGTRVFDLG